MTPEDWAKLAVALITIFGAHAGLVKFLTKHYLSELKPNGGNSIKDEVKQITNNTYLIKNDKNTIYI